MDAEWKLNSMLLQWVFWKLEISPQIDLSASRLNTQLGKFVSYRPDPTTVAVDAFSMS